MTYKIILSSPAIKQLDKLPEEIRTSLQAKIQSLAATPRPRGTAKMKGYQNEYRIRDGQYRVRYSVDDDQAVVIILQCRHRRDIYKDRS